MRFLPFAKGKKGFQFAGGGVSDSGGGGGGYVLPTASADTLGGVKVGNNLSIDANGVLSASGGGGSSLNYSTEEQNTGIKWIDGRDIFVITATFTDSYSINADIVKVECVGVTGGNTIATASNTKSEYYWEYVRLNSAIYVDFTGSSPDYKIATIYYCKRS